MTRTIFHFRSLDDEATQIKLRDLATLWSPGRALPISAIVRECVRRIHEIETSKMKEKQR